MQGVGRGGGRDAAQVTRCALQRRGGTRHPGHSCADSPGGGRVGAVSGSSLSWDATAVARGAVKGQLGGVVAAAGGGRGGAGSWAGRADMPQPPPLGISTHPSNLPLSSSHSFSPVRVVSIGVALRLRADADHALKQAGAQRGGGSGLRGGARAVGDGGDDGELAAHRVHQAHAVQAGLGLQAATSTGSRSACQSCNGDEQAGGQRRRHARQTGSA